MANQDEKKQDLESSEPKKEQVKVEEKKQEEGKEKKEQQKEEEKKVVLSQKEFDGIKIQMAKVINDYKELEKDLENYRKRSREDIEVARVDGIVKALNVILPALDTFKKAKKLIKDESSLSGVNMIEKSLFESLNKLKVKKIECVGKKFDPSYHNAVLQIEDKKTKSGHIVEEIEAGYEMDGKVIRFSQVVVAK